MALRWPVRWPWRPLGLGWHRGWRPLDLGVPSALAPTGLKAWTWAGLGAGTHWHGGTHWTWAGIGAGAHWT